MLSELKEFYIGGLCWIGILMLIGGIICAVTFYRLCIEDSSMWINKSYRNLTIITMFLVLSCSISDFVHVLIRFLWYPGQFMLTTEEKGVIITADIFYYCGNIMFYILLLTRINALFELTIFVRNLVLFFIFMAMILSIIYLCIITRGLDDSDWYKFVVYNDIALSSTDFILNTTLFIIFWMKLRYSIIDEILTIDYQNKVNLMTNILTKHSILFGIGIIANQLLFGYMIVHYANKHDHTIENDRIVLYIVRALENFIILCVLRLVLEIYYDQYICLCKCCHLCVGRCCLRTEDVMINNPYVGLREL